jgi:arginyl-tRNA synthetase
MILDIQELLKKSISKGLSELFHLEHSAESLTISPTRKEFEGDFTFTLFPYAKPSQRNPEDLGNELGTFLLKDEELVNYFSGFNVVKGFLNISISAKYWNTYLNKIYINPKFAHSQTRSSEKVMVEFASPNTNKPLHLGHIRNILLGWSSVKLSESQGAKVFKTQVINDRGIAICKSMLAWKKFGNGETPISSGMKGDHLVGKYYVMFEKEFKDEYFGWQATDTALEVVYEKNKKEGQSLDDFFKDYKNQYFNEYSQLGSEARAMLLEWENNDPETISLWKQMNDWVYDGFFKTYGNLGVSFDKNYYESSTYLLGKKVIEDGLKSGIFYQKDDTSVWIDLEEEGLGQKLVLRSDGTSVYITQDIGMAKQRYEEFSNDRVIYVVADEQNYHFKVLFETLKKLGEPYSENLFHLSYGMVELPTGRMKSREGTVVDADDLISEVIGEVETMATDRGELDVLPPKEKDEIIRKIGLGALKYFMLKVNPQKKMIFDPSESVDMQGNTGPYIMNAYVRIKSILRKAPKIEEDRALEYINYELVEKELVSLLYQYPTILSHAANELEPSHVANYCFDLAKTFHKFYHDYPILKLDNESAKSFRLILIQAIANTLEDGFEMLGIEMVERM